jgi:hypothetical protein
LFFSTAIISGELKVALLGASSCGLYQTYNLFFFFSDFYVRVIPQTTAFDSSDDDFIFKNAGRQKRIATHYRRRAENFIKRRFGAENQKRCVTRQTRIISLEITAELLGINRHHFVGSVFVHFLSKAVKSEKQRD